MWERTRENVYLDDTGNPSPSRGALQLVFCDYGTPGDPASWNVYSALRDALVDRGMDRSRIRFIHEARNDADKARLFEACRSGHVDVMMGSTQKMGVGTNIQRRAVHLMDLDAPWRPADMTQRHGRILRRGNENPEVAITMVVTEGSFDTFMYQTLERKQAFISQLMNGGQERALEGSRGLNFGETRRDRSCEPKEPKRSKSTGTRSPTPTGYSVPRSSMPPTSPTPAIGTRPPRRSSLQATTNRSCRNRVIPWNKQK